MEQQKTKTARFVARVVEKLTEEHHHGTQFMTDDVRRISEHMTEQEKRRAEWEGAIGGTIFGLLVMILPLAILAFHERLAAVVPGGAKLVLPAYIVLLIVVTWITLPYFDRWNRRNLASTAWAKSQGLKAEEIQLRKYSAVEFLKILLSRSRA